MLFSKPRRLSRQDRNPREALPILPLADIVPFPGMMIPVITSGQKPNQSIIEAVNTGSPLLLLAVREGVKEAKTDADLYDIGARAYVVSNTTLSDGSMKLIVEAEEKVRAISFEPRQGDLWATTVPTDEETSYPPHGILEVETLRRALLASFYRYLKSGRSAMVSSTGDLDEIAEPLLLVATIAMSIPGKIAAKQKILEEDTMAGRIRALIALLENEINQIKVDQKIRVEVNKSINQNQREYYLNEAMRAIQKELGDEGDDEFSALEKRIAEAPLSKEAAARVKADLNKLKKMNSHSSEANVLRNYIETVLDLPWGKRDEVKNDLAFAEKTLTEAHYGLDKIKDRILEFLAIQKRAGKTKGTILCFAGPPGVGKTSLGRAIATATGRKFAKLSLGGVHDEAEIRGHRKTYVGSTTGKILSTIKKAGTGNPLILLDEIDKMGADRLHGDPAAAMLEVLDPEQNSTFADHYLDLDYDLSEVMFITTANSLDRIARPLLDRLEIVELSGYTETEKLEIAKRHIIPECLEKNSLTAREIEIDNAALKKVISNYTRESGVRGLKRQIDKIMRKAALKIERAAPSSDNFTLIADEVKKEIIKVSAANLADYLGPEKYDHLSAGKRDEVGFVNGLAWTEVGGEMLSIETAVMEGKGEAKFTGKLGDVMKESIETAKSFIRSRSKSFGINPKIWNKIDIHIHVPEGATPKDGPSAGIAMLTSIVSTLTEIPVRRDIAMTGEMTLRGRVLAIGGLKEKLLAAMRAGIKTALIPYENEKDLTEIPDIVKEKIKIIPVKTADEVLKIALLTAPKPIVDKEPANFFARLLEDMPVASSPIIASKAQP
ncbi:MAG: endopeptidase La [Alphaproteobacteria bacterium]|nr:endopeptidase La [Alphaproteobacteria bacterium]